MPVLCQVDQLHESYLGTASWPGWLSAVLTLPPFHLLMIGYPFSVLYLGQSFLLTFKHPSITVTFCAVLLQVLTGKQVPFYREHISSAVSDVL